MECVVDAGIIIQTPPCPENAKSEVFSEIGHLLGAVEFFEAKPFLNVQLTLCIANSRLIMHTAVHASKTRTNMRVKHDES